MKVVDGGAITDGDGPLRFGDLQVTPKGAAFRGETLLLHRVELALLYALVAASGAAVTREALHQRCCGRSTRLRNVDVVACRLRAKLGRTGVRVVSERDLGYRLALPESATKTVLVVEDDALLHNAYRRSLRPLGVTIDFAESFDACASLVQRRSYDAYFVDLGVPGGSGADIIPLIQAQNPRAPIMIVSGCKDPKALALSGALGVPYAIKPVPGDTLERFVARAVGRRAVHGPRPDP